MKLLFSGGLNKYNPQGYQESYFYRYSETLKRLIVQDRNIAFVTLAKPDHYYDEHILPQFGNRVDIIGHETASVAWDKYDLLFLCGGDTVQLKSGLEKLGFQLDKLKPEVVVLGDSAGAMLMAPYFYDTEDRINCSFITGIYPKTKTIVCVHTNNPRYWNEVLASKVRQFALEKGLSIVELEEYEVKLFNEATIQFDDVELEHLFD